MAGPFAILLALIAFLVPACQGTARGSAHTSVPATPAPARPCGFLPLTSAHYSHVVWILMENHSAGAVINAPYISRLGAECGEALNYHNVTHPSLPNYIAATSGLPLSRLGPFTSDCDPAPGCTSAGPSIFSQVRSWRSYGESMPAPCSRGSSGEYAARHNPAVYYTSLASQCSSDDLPYTSLVSGPLAAFTFVTPNLIDDMHDGTVTDGDRWLASNLPRLLDSPEYRAGTVAVFITWDEGEGGSSNDCATNTTDVGCHVATLVVSPSTARGTRSGELFNHYSLLLTTEQLLGVAPLGEAGSATSMRAAFDL